jgi:transcription elongation factor GreA
MSNDPSEYISKEGYDKLHKELAFLSDFRRKEIAVALESAKALGDLSENSEYHDAKDAQAANEMRIMELEDLLRRAVVVSKHSLDVAGVGAKIVAEHMSAGTKHEFSIVSPEEAQPLVGKISYESPIGKALMGKRRGDEAAVSTPRGAVSYKILDII